MELDDIYKYIGIFVIALCVIYLASESIRFQLGLLEGFLEKRTSTKEPIKPEI